MDILRLLADTPLALSGRQTMATFDIACIANLQRRVGPRVRVLDGLRQDCVPPLGWTLLQFTHEERPIGEPKLTGASHECKRCIHRRGAIREIKYGDFR